MKLSLFVDEDPRPAPIIHQGPQNQTLPVNSIAMLQCLATGEPPPSVRWYRNGRPLSLRDQRYTLLHSGTLQIAGRPIYSLLFISRAELQNIISYICCSGKMSYLTTKFFTN